MRDSISIASSHLTAIVTRFCDRDDLSTFDPYDIWKIPLGFSVKQLYHRRPYLGFVPASVLGVVDLVANNYLRFLYSRAEYPVVRSMAALCLLSLHRSDPDPRLLQSANRHLDWLLLNSCKGYSGYCWGLGIPYTTAGNVTYSADTPMSTITPYALEAFIQAFEISGNDCYLSVIRNIFRFFDCDLRVMEEDREAMATSYGPFPDRVVINAVSYTMYAISAFLPYASNQQRPSLEAKVRKLYAFIRRHQRGDGGWLYSPYGRSFIDCFHSCIVLKNLIKSNRIACLDGAERLIAAGYDYVVSAFFDEKKLLFRRFSVKNKPNLVCFDLYDNAEALNLAVLLGDADLTYRLLNSIWNNFSTGTDLYSQIDFLGCRRNKNTLRWAVLPFLLAVSQIARAEINGKCHQHRCP